MEKEHYSQSKWRSWREIRCPFCRQHFATLHRRTGFGYSSHGLCGHIVITAVYSYDPFSQYKIEELFLHRTEYKGAHADRGDWYKMLIDPSLLNRVINREQPDHMIQLDWGSGLQKQRIEFYLRESGKTAALMEETREEFEIP